jgi:ATP-binding cassette, subfamily F, member 3
MSVLSLVNVRHSYGSRAILDGATLSVDHGEKIGLVGRNGSGKTTLMKVMTGQIVPDSGNVSVQRAARVGYLSQDPDLDPDDSVRDAAERAFAQLHDLHVRMHHLYEDMASAEGDALDHLLKQQAKLEAEIETAGGYAIDHKIDAMLHGLGFTDEQFSLKVRSLSGGQKGRLGLARLLLEEPDVLLLDEPTNHLDIAGRQWLEAFLAEEYPGAVIVVSHDRWLLDRVVHRIIEVERGMIREYPGNYHDYVALRRERQLTEARVYDKQMDRIKQEQSFIDKYRAGQRARQAKGREARLERFKRDEVNQRPIELEVMNLKLPPAARSGDQVIVAEGISKSYDDKVLFRNLDLTVTRSDRIGIIGPNGAGKTTLIKCLLGEQEPDEGTVRLGSRLNIGYYRQLHEHLDMSLSVWQYLQSVIVGLDGSAKASEQQARDLAGAFLFSGMEQDKPLGSLSGGERSRAVLAGLVAGAHNVLVLDEPSNHLDIPSAERLEQSLSSDGGFDGTLLLITHDRQLLEDVCDRLVILDGDGGSRVFPGRYSEWEERQRREREEASARKSETAARKSGGGGKDDRAQAKPQAARGAAMVATAAKVKGPHARLKVEELEKKIAAAQARMVAIDQAMADPAVYVDGAKIKALQADRAKAERELQDLEDEWLRRAE